ncbi:MAG: hypothetical protein HRT67_03605 [Flavobacteriaceae bacterium]|nr:hypothetical protein [Flavobacteriaceae bacterium]
MKRILYFTLSLIILICWSSCRKDFNFSPSSGNLRFSKDTVYLDTVFTNIGSSTYNLKVYNQSNEDIVIPSIRFTKGYDSYYRMTIDGMTGISNGTNESFGKVFENVEMLAKDSMYIFIETTIDIEELTSDDNQFLQTDAIEFDAGSNLQKVDLITLVKDAVFIYPQKYTDDQTGETITETLTFDIDGDGVADETTLQGRFLEDNELNFTNEKPYVIYGYAAVNDGKTLTIDPGARVHFHADSGLLVTEGGSLQVNGTPSTDAELMEGEVIFEGDRLEPLFQDNPGQWQAIWLLTGSTNNTINHATIKNATAALVVDGNMNDTEKLRITNSQIYNSSHYGILGRATSINAENIVINNSGQISFAGTYGGNYNLVHSTIVNYWNTSFRQYPSVLLNNFFVDTDNNTFTNALESANFTNCIIYGNDNLEFLLDDDSNDQFNFKFTNCLVRFNNSGSNLTGENYDFNDTNIYEQVIFNEDPQFLDPFANKLQIPDNSPADGQGIVFGDLNSDILNTPRSGTPDIGAYESIVFDDDED